MANQAQKNKEMSRKWQAIGMEIFLDCLFENLGVYHGYLKDFGSRESLEIGNQGVDQAPMNIPWCLEAIPEQDVS